MALTWEWTDKMGEVTYEDGTSDTLYQGNAYMIAISQSDMLIWFACDKDHLKRMLGLVKGYDNMMKDWHIKKFRFNLAYKTVPEIVSLLIKAGLEIKIETYREATHEDD